MRKTVGQMAVRDSASTRPAPPPRCTETLAALTEGRETTLAIVAGVGCEDLECVHSPLMSPLVWDLGHIATFEDLWLVHRHGGEELLRPELLEVYDAFETPRAGRGELPYLRHDDAYAYLSEVRERAIAVLERAGEGDGVNCELVVRHERQHAETMLQTLMLARLSDHKPPVQISPDEPSGGHTGLELVDVPGGSFTMGAPDHGFAYDNERPRHDAYTPPFRIGKTPVTNATWLTFSEGGGYERREWWSDEGWAWKEQYDIWRPLHWTEDGREWRLTGAEPLDPDRPVVHISWFEADAFCRAHGVRLPTEHEWERAATWNQEPQTKQPWPWGEAGPTRVYANLIEARAFGTTRVGARPANAAPCGALDMVGNVWEWTSSDFAGYPAFRAHPYREYSEVFFGTDYKVLRGGSWASSARVATPTFRNWDFPARRQIFAGLRVAAEAAA
jgi:gamma-glutamyl hercynylcysteine S-oxide synthase